MLNLLLLAKSSTALRAFGKSKQTSKLVVCCAEILRNVGTEFLDGQNAIQWATYTILQGEHQGKKILAYMGTDFSNFEQVAADIFSVPFATDLMRNMRDEAVAIANAESPDYITGHSLGGILAELVCSETGIPGASFAALGAFDPYSQADQELGNTSYNGLVENNMHQNTAFEVVMNTYDIASAIASIDGSACSHITSSCNVRWLWFGDSIYEAYSSTAGHSSVYYSLMAATEFTRGWESYEEATIDPTLTLLPGVQGNHAYDCCFVPAMCDSGRCGDEWLGCYGSGGMPTTCPAQSIAMSEGSSRVSNRGYCYSGSDCASNRCEFSSSPSLLLLNIGEC